MVMKNRWQSIKYALQGLSDAIQTQPNLRIHLMIALVVVLVGCSLSLTRLEWIAVVLTIALVLLAELLNTAIEYLTNLVSPEYHPLAGKTKDAAAAAVLITAIAAVVVGLLIFLPKLWLLLSQIRLH
jgi:diacylglycerol kinase